MKGVVHQVLSSLNSLLLFKLVDVLNRTSITAGQ